MNPRSSARYAHLSCLYPHCWRVKWPNIVRSWTCPSYLGVFLADCGKGFNKKFESLPPIAVPPSRISGVVDLLLNGWGKIDRFNGMLANQSCIPLWGSVRMVKPPQKHHVWWLTNHFSCGRWIISGISGFTHVLYCNPSVCWWKIFTFADKNPPLLLLKSPTVPPLSVWSKWLNGLQHGHTPARFHHLLRGCQALCVARKLQMANLTCFFTLSFNMLKHLRRASVLRFPRRRTLNPKTLNHPKP